jgi:NADH:ubiquinone oxidoreductase subunit 6 (subunit J)
MDFIDFIKKFSILIFFFTICLKIAKIKFIINSTIILACIVILGLITFIAYSTSMISILISLLVTYIISGMIFITLGLEFLGFMSMIIFSGAIIILFIFVLMLVNFKHFKNIDFMYIDTFFNLLWTLSFFTFIFLCVFPNDTLLVSLYFLDWNFAGFSFVINTFLIKWFLFNRNYIVINNLIEHSSLYKISYILFNISWFETLFLGLILLVAVVIIIYLFKR